MMTAIFVAVIVHCKYPQTASSKDGTMICITIALTLMAVAGMIGGTSGGCFNPTIGLTETTMMMIFDPEIESQYFKYMVVYIFGPLAGGILAAIYFVLIPLRVPVGPEFDKLY
jgi:glycerol uptake facilitator-like aquaporin